MSILEGYGLSETSPVASFTVLDLPKKAGSIRLPISGVEFRLEDAEGNVIQEATRSNHSQYGRKTRSREPVTMHVGSASVIHL